MAFSQEMLEIKKNLEGGGYVVSLPGETEAYIFDPSLLKTAVDGVANVGAERKIKNDFIRRHYEKIKESDAILVLNYDRRGIKNYIGGNTFLEMGFAHILNKPIYLMRDIPAEMNFILEEIMAMQPVVLNGDLSKLL